MGPRSARPYQPDTPCAGSISGNGRVEPATHRRGGDIAGSLAGWLRRTAGGSRGPSGHRERAQAKPDAGILSFGDLDPLPRHLLETAFNEYEQAQASRETFLGNRAWATEYIGAGPYRLERWEPGAQLEGVAFDGHVLGRPRIDRLV